MMNVETALSEQQIKVVIMSRGDDHANQSKKLETNKI